MKRGSCFHLSYRVPLECHNPLFFVDGSSPGKWQINVKYKGNKKLSPVYMKLTKFTNYNTPAQKIDVSVFRLAMKNVNQKLTDFDNVVSLSDN